MQILSFLRVGLLASAALSAASAKAEDISGVGVRVANTPDAEARAEAQIKSLGEGDWVLLERSNSPGHGAAMCAKVGGRIQFYAVHGFSTAKEAIQAARVKAQAAGTLTSLCSRGLWEVKSPLTPTREEDKFMKQKPVATGVRG